MVTGLSSLPQPYPVEGVQRKMRSPRMTPARSQAASTAMLVQEKPEPVTAVCRTSSRSPAQCRATPPLLTRSAHADRWVPREQSGHFVWTGELVGWLPVDVLKADEGATFELAGILEER